MADVSFEGMMDILASTPRLFFGFLGLTPSGCSGMPCWLLGLEELCLAAETCPLLKILSSRYFSDRLPLPATICSSVTQPASKHPT